MLGELVEEGVLAVVGGPDGKVAGPGDAGLGGLPEEAGVRVLGEFVEANVAAVNGHGVGVGGESNDPRAVIEFDVTDTDFFGERAGNAVAVEGFGFEDVLAVAEDGAGIAEHVGEGVNILHVFQGAGPILGGEEIVAFFEAEAFTNVFEAVTEGPANANGFFRESKDLPFGLMKGVFGLDPTDLVRGEVMGQKRIGVYFDEGQYCRHRIFDF